MTIYVQDNVTITSTIVDSVGSPANPAKVVFRVVAPSGTETTYEVGVFSGATVVTAGTVYKLVFNVAESGFYEVWTEAYDGSNALVRSLRTVFIADES